MKTTLSITLTALLLLGCTVATAADSPFFRGPNGDGIFPETGLLKSWPDGGPPVIWVANGLGNGYASVSVVGDTIYAQLGVTYTLSVTGMLMVLFIKPPNRFWAGDTPVNRDERFIWMVLVMFILFGIVLVIPLAQELLKIAPLQQIEHYLIIAGVTIVWALLTKMIWILPGVKLKKD